MVLRTISEIDEHAERLNNAASRQDKQGVQDALAEIKAWFKEHEQYKANAYIEEALRYTQNDPAKNEVSEYLNSQLTIPGPSVARLLSQSSSSAAIRQQF